MKNLSKHKLNWLLFIFISLFIILIFYVFSLLSEEKKRFLLEPVKSTIYGEPSPSEKDLQLDYEKKINKEQVTGNSLNHPSLEVQPNKEALFKDSPINLDKIDKLHNLEIERPAIHLQERHSTFGKKVALIYFSHNRESFLPYFEEGTEPTEAYHSKLNITLVGERFGKALQYNGIWNTVNNTDIINMLKSRSLNFSKSYEMSRDLVLEEKNNNTSFEMFFDLHRDSLSKKYTTHFIQGEPYAKISFVVGSGHKNYKKNLQFANSIDQLINQNYPGLSRGVIIKSASQGNGIYNQDLSPNSVIMEIGGVENTMEELYRSTDILGYVISQYYWENFH